MVTETIKSEINEISMDLAETLAEEAYYKIILLKGIEEIKKSRNADEIDKFI